MTGGDSSQSSPPGRQLNLERVSDPLEQLFSLLVSAFFFARKPAGQHGCWPNGGTASSDAGPPLSQHLYGDQRIAKCVRDDAVTREKEFTKRGWFGWMSSPSSGLANVVVISGSAICQCMSCSGRRQMPMLWCFYHWWGGDLITSYRIVFHQVKWERAEGNKL